MTYPPHSKRRDTMASYYSDTVSTIHFYVVGYELVLIQW